MNRQYEIGDLLYHPRKRSGSKYAIVVKTFDDFNQPEHPVVLFLVLELFGWIILVIFMNLDVANGVKPKKVSS